LRHHTVHVRPLLGVQDCLTSQCTLSARHPHVHTCRFITNTCLDSMVTHASKKVKEQVIKPTGSSSVINRCTMIEFGQHDMHQAPYILDMRILNYRYNSASHLLWPSFPVCAWMFSQDIPGMHIIKKWHQLVKQAPTCRKRITLFISLSPLCRSLGKRQILNVPPRGNIGPKFYIIFICIHVMGCLYILRADHGTKILSAEAI